jgi:spoIIIJ-associated protein
METRGVVFEGKTLDDAVKKGLHALGLSRAEVMITVEEEGSAGFLGIGARPYRVRMMPRPRRGMAERGERVERGRRGAGAEPREARDNRNGRRARPTAEPAGRPEGGDGRRRRRRGRPREGDGRAGAAAEPAMAALRGPGRGPRHEDRRPGAPGAVESRESGREHREPAPAVPPAELTAEVRRLADDLFKAMGFEARVSVQMHEGDDSTVGVRAEVPVDGELLTGEKGEVRQALQHLLNRMLNRAQVSRYHVQLEVNDFWRQREAELQDLARRLAEEAVAENAEKVTEYLNAQERRIVHVTLREDARVRTYAIGDGLIKKVAVAPAAPAEESKPEA